jgi:uncharacterized membrane protein YdfJ with MMPL/SSD domain
MASVLYRTGRGITRHPVLVILVWVALVAAVAVAVSRVGAETTDDLSLPGTDSQAATDLLAGQFPPQQNGTSPIVFKVRSGTVEDQASKKAISESVAAVSKLPDVVSAPSPFGQQGASLISADKTTAYTPVLLDISAGELSVVDAQGVLDAALKPAAAQGMQVAVGGPIGSTLSTPETESSEIVGIVLAMIILAFAFGSIVAMGMPIVSALFGLVPALCIIGLLGHLASIPSIAPTLATMIGLGVGIDYALFFVSRHRAGLADGLDVPESIGRTLATSGSAILFAGGTVVIALASLAVAGIPFVTALGLASAVAVLTAVLAALTLLPAVLALLGTRVDAWRLPAFLRPKQRAEGAGLWAAWSRFVTGRPRRTVLIAVAVLVPLIIPVFFLTLGQEDIGTTPTSTTERQAYDLMSAEFGPGYNGPLLIAVSLPTPATADPTVQAQEDQVKALQSELEQEQKEGEQQQKELTRQSDELKADQAALEQQQAALEAQAARLRSEQVDLERQAASLSAQEASLTAQARTLRAQETSLRAQAQAAEQRVAGLRGEREGLRARARGLEGQVVALVAQARSLEGRLTAVRARRAEVQKAITGSDDPARRRALGAALASLQAEEARARGQAARLRAQAGGLPARAGALRSQAESLRAQAPGLRARARSFRSQAASLARRSAALAAQAASLARQGAALAAQASSLESQGAALQADGAELQSEGAELQERADALTTQEAQLEQLQRTAAAQQKQAEELQAELTTTLTKAGGDARGTDPRLVALQDALAGTPGVDLVSPPRINDSGSAAIYSVIPTTAPSDEATADLVQRLRTTVIPDAIDGTDLVVNVGGSTASNVDLAAEISSKLLLVIGVVLALSFLVLLVAFRSLLVPLQAALVNALSVAAAFGVLTACFQFGWGISLVGVDTTADSVPIASFVPLMMFAVLFGLSMDYQVFLLSQVAQSRAAGQDGAAAVASGLRASGKVICAAGLIMMGVFGSFILNGDPIVKQFGVGLTVAVALAASMVLLLAPALLVLMGGRAWWLPRWLGRVLPAIDIEGEGLIRKREAAASVDAGVNGEVSSPGSIPVSPPKAARTEDG